MNKFWSWGKDVYLRDTFASFGYRNYMYLWLGQTTHSGALWIDMVVRPLLVLDLTGSPLHLGMVMASRALPNMMLSVFAGVVADSFNRRTVLMVTKILILLISAIFASLIIMGWIQLWQVYVLTFLRGSTMAFDQPARRAIIPSIVPDNLVTNAMALSSSSIQVMRILGAGTAGLIIAISGIEMAFVAIVVFYAAALYFTYVMKLPEHQGIGYKGLNSARNSLVEGIRFAFGDPAIRGVFIVALGYYAFGMTFISIFAPLFAIEILGLGSSGLGYLMSVVGIGGVIGSLCIAAINPVKRGLLLLGVLMGLGGSLVLFAILSYTGLTLILFVLAAFIGVCTAVFLPVINAVLVQAAPENMRGRVLGLVSLGRGMTTLGGVAAGLLVVLLGLQVSQIIFGVGCIFSAIIIFLIVPQLKKT